MRPEGNSNGHRESESPRNLKQRFGHGVSASRHKLAGGLGEAKYLAAMAVIKPAVWVLRQPAVRWGERMIEATPFEFAPGFDEDFVQAIKDGCIPMLIMNHTSDFDGLEAAHLTQYLADLANANLPEDKQIKNFLMITALSLKKGKSRIFEKLFYDAFGRFLDIHHIEPIYTSTYNDQAVRGENGNTKEYLDELGTKLQMGQYAIFFFPEGKVEGGRIDPETGERKGLQNFVPRRIADYIHRIEENTGRPVVVIKAAVSEGWRVYDHRRRKLPLPTTNIRIGFGWAKRKPGDLNGVHVRVGLPDRSDKGWLAELLSQKTQQAEKAIDRIFGIQIAQMLPIGQRGVHEKDIAPEGVIFPG